MLFIWKFPPPPPRIGILLIATYYRNWSYLLTWFATYQCKQRRCFGWIFWPLSYSSAAYQGLASSAGLHILTRCLSKIPIAQPDKPPSRSKRYRWVLTIIKFSHKFSPVASGRWLDIAGQVCKAVPFQFSLISFKTKQYILVQCSSVYRPFSMNPTPRILLNTHLSEIKEANVESYEFKN